MYSWWWTRERRCTNAAGDRKLLTEYNVPSLTGMIINELTDINLLKSTLKANLLPQTRRSDTSCFK